jgi:hypothetical protein
LTGCSGQRLLKVRGTITNNKKVVPIGNGGMSVLFVPVVEKGQPTTNLPATYNKADGTFEVNGTQGKGIPVGKYRVAINLMPTAPSEAMDALNKRFSVASSPVVLEINSDEPLTIELDKYK